MLFSVLLGEMAGNFPIHSPTFPILATLAHLLPDDNFIRHLNHVPRRIRNRSANNWLIHWVMKIPQLPGEVLEIVRGYFISAIRAVQLPLELYDLRQWLSNVDHDWRRHNWTNWAHFGMTLPTYGPGFGRLQNNNEPEVIPNVYPEYV
jgi:hypothetical protein